MQSASAFSSANRVSTGKEGLNGMEQRCASYQEYSSGEQGRQGMGRRGTGSTHALTAALICVLGACGSEQPEAAGKSASTTVGGAQLSGAAGAAAHTVTSAQPTSTAAVPSATPASANLPAAAVPGASAAPAQTAAAPGALPCGVSKTLESSCQNCHGAKPIAGAPMALVTYADLMKPAVTQPNKKVYELVQTRIHDTARPMPPVGALAAADVAAIDTWVQGGAKTAPSTDAACAPAPTVEAVGLNRDFTTGRLPAGPGETCYEFKVHGSTTAVDDTKFNVNSGEFYEQFYYKVPWPAGTVATAYATVGDNVGILHHWLLFSTNELQVEGAHITAPLPTLIGNDPMLLAGWAAGGPNLVTPSDVGFELPDPGRTINVQWHFYNSTGQAQADASSLQICTVPKAMRKNIGNITWAGTEDLNGNKWFGGAGMPPHKESTFKATCIPGRRGMGANDSIKIIGFEPHMHRIGKHMQTSVKHMDGGLEMIFDKPFSFGSETHYPMDYDLKPGEQLVTSCTFNNDNDFGVPFGESTDSEMCYQFTYSYPAHALSNGAASLIGVPDTCW